MSICCGLRRRSSAVHPYLLLILGGCLLLGPILLVSAAHPQRIDLELWVELQPIAGEEDPTPLSREEAARRLLEEARYVLAAMVYGFEFRYVPRDRERGVAEEFVLTPIAEVAWGASQLSILETRREENLLHGRVRYTLSSHEEYRREAWSRNSVSRSAGTGTAPRILGVAAKQHAVEDAMRHAVHEYVRARVHNRPQEISGRLVLKAAPRVFVRSGEYRASVQVGLILRDIRSYAIF